MKIFKDILPPSGITTEDWEERKRILKRKALIRWLLLVFIVIFIFEFITWGHGGYEQFQPKRLEELQVKSGILTYGGRMPQLGLKDSTTGDRMGFQAWLLSGPDIQKIKGHNVTIWYYTGQANINYVYQLKADDVLVFDIDRSNQKGGEIYENVNRRNSIARILIDLIFAIFFRYVYYRKYKEWLLKKI